MEGCKVLDLDQILLDIFGASLEEASRFKDKLVSCHGNVSRLHQSSSSSRCETTYDEKRFIFSKIGAAAEVDVEGLGLIFDRNHV